MAQVPQMDIYLRIQNILCETFYELPIVIIRCLAKLSKMLLIDKIGAEPILRAIIKWKKATRFPKTIDIVKKTTMKNWKVFEEVSSAELIIDLLISWLTSNCTRVIERDKLTNILANSKLNLAINNVICFPDSFSHDRLISIIESVKTSLTATEFLIAKEFSDFFTSLYADSTVEMELFSEAMLAISSTLIGNKDLNQVENFIFETELLSRIIKLLILNRTFEEEGSLLASSFDLKDKNMRSLDNVRLNHISASRINKTDSSHKFNMPRSSNSSVKSILKLLQPMGSSNFIKSKFGSGVTDYYSIFSEKSSLGQRQERNLSAIRLSVPLSHFDLKRESAEKSEDYPRIELVSSRPSNTTSMQNTVTKKVLPKFKISGHSQKWEPSEERYSKEKRMSHEKQGMILENPLEQSFEQEIKEKLQW